MNHEMRLYHYPTTVVLIDDDHQFIQVLKQTLNDELVKLFTNPLHAKDYLGHQKDKAIQAVIKTMPLEEERSDTASIHLDINKIQQLRFNQHRFDEVSVAVVDYAMPQCDGLEVCQQVKQQGIPCILLTGEADDRIAINAFNQGLIDQFIMKHDDELISKLGTWIHRMRQRYFANQWNQLLPNRPYWFDSEPGKNHLQAILKQYQIVEYYLLDQYGNYLLLDREAKHWLLIMYDETTLADFYEMAVDAEAALDVLNQLKNRQYAPFFLSDDDKLQPPTHWQSYLYPVKRIDLDKPYFYALVACDDDVAVHSFNDFLSVYRQH